MDKSEQGNPSTTAPMEDADAKASPENQTFCKRNKITGVRKPLHKRRNQKPKGKSKFHKACGEYFNLLKSINFPDEELEGYQVSYIRKGLDSK